MEIVFAYTAAGACMARSYKVEAGHFDVATDLSFPFGGVPTIGCCRTPILRVEKNEQWIWCGVRLEA